MYNATWHNVVKTFLLEIWLRYKPPENSKSDRKSIYVLFFV